MAKKLKLKERYLPGRWVYWIKEKPQREAYKAMTGKKHVTKKQLPRLRELGVTLDIESTEDATEFNKWFDERGGGS